MSPFKNLAQVYQLAYNRNKFDEINGRGIPIRAHGLQCLHPDPRDYKQLCGFKALLQINPATTTPTTKQVRFACGAEGVL